LSNRQGDGELLLEDREEGDGTMRNGCALVEFSRSVLHRTKAWANEASAGSRSLSSSPLIGIAWLL